MTLIKHYLEYIDTSPVHSLCCFLCFNPDGFSCHDFFASLIEPEKFYLVLLVYLQLGPYVILYKVKPSLQVKASLGFETITTICKIAGSCL